MFRGRAFCYSDLGLLLVDLSELTRGPLSASSFAPGLGLGRRNRRTAECRPVEGDARILRLERAYNLIVKHLASDLDVWRRPEPIQDARPRFAATARHGLDEVDVLISALVS